MKRRDFIGVLGGATAALATTRLADARPKVPSYLKGREKQYAGDPRAAAVQWFREARFGLFIHWGLYSLMERHEWEQHRQRTAVAEYARLKDRFTGKGFDADRIADLALAAGMKYINLVTRHHDSFCLFKTRFTEFHSVNSPARRDFVAELAKACDRKRLGLCLYYSHGRDWRHPHAPNNDEWGGNARPKYDPPEPSYAYGKDHDLQKYLDFMTGQITELLTHYGPVAAIWLDGIAVPLSGDRAKFKCQELYDHIHKLQPQVLVSYKQGLLGTEDFFAPERKAALAVANSTGKPVEICDTLQEHVWGYSKDARHRKADEVMAMLDAAANQRANLLLNTGPLPDGSIHAGDEATLREVGRRLKRGA
jgi:alpha-L-fucosidase